MEREYGVEIDALRQELEEIKKLFGEFTSNHDSSGGEEKNYKNIQPMWKMHPDPKLSILMENLCKHADDNDISGSVTYLGVFSSGGRQSNWIRNMVSTDELLSLIENKSASAVLSCIGNNDRLNLLLALLKTPMSVASLVEKCGFNSTGQVYHHLKPLIAADIVCELEQPERGVYAVKFHRIQGIIMMLCGIADLVDPKYSQGSWEEE